MGVGCDPLVRRSFLDSNHEENQPSRLLHVLLYFQFYSSIHPFKQLIVNSKNRKAEPNDPAFLGLFVPVFSDFIFLLVPANPIIPKPRNSMMAGSDIVCSI